MRKLTSLVIVWACFFCNTTSAQSSLQELVTKSLDEKFMITASNKPYATNGVIILEESHNNQFNSIDQLLSIYRNDAGENKFDKIVLEGLSYPFQGKFLQFDSSATEEQNIYRKLLRSYVIKPETYYNFRQFKAISNAEFLHLAYRFDLLQGEDQQSYSENQKLIAELSRSYSGDRARPISVITSTSNEHDLEDLVRNLGDSAKTNPAVAPYFTIKKNYHTLVGKRSDTIAAMVKNHYEQFKKVFCITGIKHSSRITEQLERYDIPFVVIAEKLNFYDDSSMLKPSLVIDKPAFKLMIEQAYLKCLLQNALLKNIAAQRYLSSVTVQKIVDQFEMIKDVGVNDNYLQYKINGEQHSEQILPDNNFAMVFGHIKDDFPTTFEGAHMNNWISPEYNTTIGSFRQSVIKYVGNYLKSPEYKKIQDKTKYRYANGKPSRELDWSDAIIYDELHSKGLHIVKQCAKAKGLRPDWYFTCTDGNWVGEVKYIRNKATYNYVRKLLLSDQLEEYLQDPRLNLSGLDVFIFIDRKGLNKLGITNATLDQFMRMLQLKTAKLQLNMNKPVQAHQFEVKKRRICIIMTDVFC